MVHNQLLAQSLVPRLRQILFVNTASLRHEHAQRMYGTQMFVVIATLRDESGQRMIHKDTHLRRHCSSKEGQFSVHCSSCQCRSIQIPVATMDSSSSPSGLTKSCLERKPLN